MSIKLVMILNFSSPTEDFKTSLPSWHIINDGRRRSRNDTVILDNTLYYAMHNPELAHFWPFLQRELTRN